MDANASTDLALYLLGCWLAFGQWPALAAVHFIINRKRKESTMADKPTAASSSAMPDKKIWQGGLAGLVTVLLLQAVQAVWPDVVLPDVVEAIVSLAVGYTVSYLVPPTLGDLLRRIDGMLKDVQAHPATNTAAVQEAKAVLYEEVAKTMPPSERPTELKGA